MERDWSYFVLVAFGAGILWLLHRRRQGGPRRRSDRCCCSGDYRRALYRCPGQRSRARRAGDSAVRQRGRAR